MSPLHQILRQVRGRRGWSGSVCSSSLMFMPEQLGMFGFSRSYSVWCSLKELQLPPPIFLGSRRMVQLKFTVQIGASLEEVWAYFSDFGNIAEWDPNAKSVALLKEEKGRVGSTYDLVSIWNGNESHLTYHVRAYQEYEQECYTAFWGENQNVTCDDELICRRKGPGETELEYRADICMKGIKVLYTPFILKGLKELTESCRQGCINKAKERWQRAE